MFRYEYELYVNGEIVGEFSKENASESILKKSLPMDVLAYSRVHNIPIGEISIDVTICYDGEYFDFDTYDLVIGSNYESLDLLTA